MRALGAGRRTAGEEASRMWLQGGATPGRRRAADGCVPAAGSARGLRTHARAAIRARPTPRRPPQARGEQEVGRRN